MIAKIAPEISCIASWVAARTGMSFSSILAWTASTTTIALSTTIPMAKTREKRVNKLIENPKASINVNVPTSETGTAIIGTKVARQSCKKINTTSATKIKASNKVLITSWMEASKKRDTSYEIVKPIPGGKVLVFNSAKRFFTFSITSAAFEPGRCFNKIAADGRPFSFESTS